MDTISPDDLSDPFVAETLKTISELEDDNPEFHNVASSLSEPLAIAGYTHRLTSTNKADAMLKIMLHDVILSRKAEIDQLALGLGPVLELAKANPESMRSLFTATDLKPLTSESFLELCTFQPTVPADLKTSFIQYVQEAGSKKLSDLLQFCTGSASVPVMGFHSPEKIEISTTRSVYPNASTCSMILELPGQCVSEVQLRNNLDTVLDMQATGFGVV
ncbi:uncharacterized protein LOC134188205 isoform X1 [Corticium candelabrum]|nr:uncharacterized protein LOC134188205 isoform X1 [Corticium candelabrum]